MDEREIFFEALEMPSPEARAAYLQGACGRDVTLRRKVDELLKEHYSNDSLLDGPALQQRRAGSLFDSDAAVAPGQMLGRYKLLERIGEGGFGEVWMAEQREPVKRRVALKIVKLGMDSRQVVARFEAERQALAMMDHANIARIYDADVTDTGRPYFVMELVRGIKITEYCDQHQLTMQERLELFIKVCQAIQHAHQKGIIHRDIKPSNILVTLHDGVPVPKVIDFGIAKATQQELTDKTVFTQFQQFIGTPAYISPEQAEMSGLDIDTRADIYSLGVLLYELLIGQTPFDPQEMMKGGIDALRRLIREKEPLRPSTRVSSLQGDDRTTTGKLRKTDVGRLAHQLQGDLDWIVMKCLEKDRTRRYDTANGLAMDIQRHLAHEPVTARPPSTAYRLRKVLLRNRLAATAIAIVTVALVLSVGGVLLVQHRANLDYRQRLYVAEIKQAGLAWRSGQSAVLRESLERCPSDLRGWEWHFLHQQADRWEATVVLGETGRRGAGFAVAVESHLLAASTSKEIRIREFPGGQWLRSIPFTVRYENASAVSPRGELLATADDSEAIHIWNMRTGERVTEIADGAPTTKFSWTADGRRLVFGCADGMIRFWDAASGRVVRTLPGPVEMSFVAVSPDDQTLAVISGGGRVLLLDSATGGVKRTLRTPAGHSTHLKFSPDSRKLAACVTPSFGPTWDNRVWDLTAEDVGTLDLMIGANVHAYDFSPDSRQILVADARGMIRIWDLERRTEIDRFSAHTSWALSVQWLPDGRILSSGNDGTKVWRGRHPESAQFKGPRSSLRSLAFSPNGRLVAAAGTAPEVSVLDLADDQPERIYRANQTRVHSVAFRPDGMIASGGQHSVQLWDPATLETKWEHRLAPAPAVFWIAFSPDGRRIFVSSEADFLKVLDAGTGTQIQSIDGLGHTFDGLAVSPDGRLLALCQKEGQEKLTVRSAENLRELWQVPSFSERCAAFSPDGRWIATGDRDGGISLWETATQGRVRRRLRGHGLAVTSVGFHPDGSRLATSSLDGQIKVWDWNAGAELLTLPLPGGTGAWHVTWSPDGSMIAAAGQDGTVTLWGLK